jgi:hypothetical protein
MNPCQAPTPAEDALLAVLEDQIQRNLDAIRNEHWYRGRHATFEDWLRERFSLEALQKGGGQ